MAVSWIGNLIYSEMIDISFYPAMPSLGGGGGGGEFFKKLHGLYLITAPNFYRIYSSEVHRYRDSSGRTEYSLHCYKKNNIVI